MTGLKSDDTFSVTGLFDLVVPLANGDGYGVRLTDRFTGSPFNIGNDHIQLFVIRNFSGVLGISLNAQDFSTGTSTALAFAALDTGHAQIALRLERASASSNDLTASYAYGDGGVLGDFVSFANHATIFHGEGYTRAGFMAFGLAPPIPEPQTYALMLAGLGLLGAATRHRRKRS
ncbi:MAG: PEP-CTERM sorting domain-containing protein [Candidatus Parcubacteria bacterium]|nr:PEP-CTERM sorting domain-containing protein [Burkholderiales bacterium]